jgi:hypothetical protein
MFGDGEQVAKGWREEMKRDPSYWTADAIRARHQAVLDSFDKPKPKPKIVLPPLEVSPETAANVRANPQDVKVATKDANGVSRIERAVVVEGTFRELAAKTPTGYVLGPKEYYEQQEQGFRERGSAGSVTHSYDPFASLDEGGEA